MDLIAESYISFVNLDSRWDRRAHMEQTLAALGLPVRRTRGLLPSECPVPARRVEVMRQRTPGAIGCHFAQVSIMKEALQRGQHAWVMEDDLIFCADFHARLQHMERFLETHPWDILWLGATFHLGPPWWHTQHGRANLPHTSDRHLERDAETTDDPRMIRTYGAFCTYAYVIRRESLPTVLELLDRHLDQSIGIDWLMIEIQPQIYSYAFVPGSVKQMDGRSDIGRGVTVFSQFSKLGPYWFQDRMEQFDPITFDWKEVKLTKGPCHT